MLRTFTLFAILLWGFSLIAHAQSQNPDRTINMEVQRILKRQSQNNMPAAKGTARQERLIGSSRYSTLVFQSPLKIIDSAYYKYNSYTRGSDLDNRMLITYLDITSEGMRTAARPYPVNNLSMFIYPDNATIQYDSANYFAYQSDGSLLNDYRLTRVYTSALLTMQYVRETRYAATPAIVTTDRYSYDYDSAHRLVYAAYLPDNPLMTDDYAMYRKYSGNLVIKDSIPRYWPQQIEYIYDTNDKLVQLRTYKVMTPFALQLSRRETFTYDTNGLLYTWMRETSLNNIMRPEYIDTFRYQGNNISYHSNHYGWNDSTASWEGTGTIERSYYNAGNNLDSLLVENVTATSRNPASKTYYTYTAYNHFDKIKTYNYKASGYSTTPDEIRNFYYELYDPTGIRRISKNTLHASIYPNPAKEALFISFNDLPKSPTEVRIYNLNGQVIQQTVMQQSQSRISLQNLTPGTYIINLENNDGSQRMQFVKY